MATTNDIDDSTDLTELLDKLEENICQVVLGKRDVIRQCIVALLTGEHVLLEDVPGVGKTLVGRAIARSISGGFCRLQFTPDLLPSDIIGSTVFNSNTSEFLFQKGPVTLFLGCIGPLKVSLNYFPLYLNGRRSCNKDLFYHSTTFWYFGLSNDETREEDLNN